MLSVQRVGEEDIAGMLFSRKDSRDAARAFMNWLKGRGGKCTKSEMNSFSHVLASGKLGYRLSRTNFYKTILHRFIELGLMAEQIEYDYRRKRNVKVYRAVIQPIAKRRPMAPSLTYLAHLIAERWNSEFTSRSSA